MDLPRREPTDGPLTFDELGLAVRNRSLPLEALQWDTTPPGLHYLLVHFDIPAIDAATWRLRVGGLVRRPLGLTLADVMARPATTLSVTMECAGNGRARLQPRPVSQPWLGEAIGTARWTGTPLAPILEEAGIEPGAVELVFTGADRGIQGGREEDYGRSLTIAEAMRPEVLLAWAMDAEPLPAAARLPAPAARARLVWHDQRQVADEHRGGRRAVPGLPADGRLPVRTRQRRPGRAGAAHARPGPDDPAGHPRVPHPAPLRGRRAHRT